MQDPLIPLPEVVQSKIMYQGYFEVREDLLKLPSGPEQHYSVINLTPEAVVILAETSSKDLVILKEYRHPTSKWLYGCPGGAIDAGETVIEAAKRELLEETGYTAKKFDVLGSSYPFPGSCSQKVYYVLAQDAELTHPTAHETFELIHVEIKSPNSLHKEILQGAALDGILCTALYFKSLFQGAM